MKTLKKLMVVLVASIMAFGSYLALPLSKIVAKAENLTNTNGAVKVKKVPTELNLEENSSVKIPFSADNFSGVTGKKAVRVYNGTNRVVAEYKEDEENANYDASSKMLTFAPTSAGTYSIVYGYYDADEKFNRVSDSYALTVVGKVDSFSFAENSEFYLPSKVPAKNGQIVKIPYPSVVLSDGTVLNVGDEGYNVSIEVSGEFTIKTEDDKYKYVELTDATKLGLYEVRYTYGNTILTKNFEVVNRDNYDTSKLTYTTSVSSWTESAIRYKGEEFTLPTVTVKDSSSNDVTNQVFNKITVKYFKNGIEEKNTDNSIFKLNGNKLTIYKDAVSKDDSHYEISYEITDYFGNKVDASKKYLFKITNVSSYRNAPSVYAVEGYTDEDKDVAVMDYAIPSTFNYIENEKDTIKLPAIIAEDNYGSTEFTYTRTIKYTDSENKTTKKVVEKDIEKEEGVKYLPNEVASFKLLGIGDYVITYSATSTLTGKTNENVYYEFKVVDGKESSTTKVESKPKIVLPSLPTSVKAGETVEIKVPTVNDYETDTNTIIDKRVQLTVETDKGELVRVINKYEITGYKFTAPTEAGNVKLTFTATNDNGTVTTREVTIKVIAEDTDPATVENIEGLEEGKIKVEDDIVSLPTVTFDDANKDSLEISVTVYDPKGNIVTGIKNVSISNGTISGGSFVAGLAGDYTIVYTAMDLYSNASSIMFFVKNVNGSTGYIQTGLESEFPTHAEPNEKITLPAAIFQLNGEVKDDAEYELRVIKASNSYTLTGNRDFTARGEGEFIFAYYIAGEKISIEYTLTVSDTIKPELNIDSLRPSTVLGYDAEHPETINIPVFNPSDPNSTNPITDYGIKITKNGKTFLDYTGSKLVEKFYKDADGNDYIPSVYYFTPDGNGVYVVEYYAVDAAGNKTSKKLEAINVGDVDTPEIIINAKIPTTVNKNETISFKASDITIIDSSEATYTITVKGPNKETVSNTGAEGIYAFKFTTSGDYTLTITADDGHGHTSNEVKTITVKTEEYKSKINTEVLGIVLIVVSLLILGGVVFYFIKTRDKKPKTDKDSTKE